MSWRWHGILVLLLGLLSACGHTRLPEERTEDGLVRVPSRVSGGVYRDTNVDFTPYKRFILEPPTIEFRKGWRDEHPEVDDRELARLRDETARLFRDEFERVLVRQGHYEFAAGPASDVLRVVPRVVDLDIPAPDAGYDIAQKAYTRAPVRMQVTGELRDAASNALVARIIVFEGEFRYPVNELRLANRTTNAHEMRVGFGKWAMMVREVVAKASRPRR